MQFVRDKRIRFQHCDAAGIVFNPQYLVLCNELIEDWFTEGLGVDYACLHRDARLGTPMIRVEADFLRASGLGDTLAFHLTVERVGAASLHLSIEARAADEPQPDPAGIATGDRTSVMDAGGNAFVVAEPKR